MENKPLSPKSKPRPNTVNGKVPPPRRPNAARRPREYLTEKEVDQLIETARKRGRHGHRDSTAILVAYRHALRVSELCSLRWDAIDLESGLMHVRRLKNGTPSVHPLRGVEIRALRRLERETPVSPYVFTTERRGPMTPAGFRKTLAAIAEAASFPFPIHPHMLRHSAGYKLVNDREDTRSVQHYMGHKNIQHTVRYTELATGRFDSFWED